jgi:hypothetical protein
MFFIEIGFCVGLYDMTDCWKYFELPGMENPWLKFTRVLNLLYHLRDQIQPSLE